MKMSGRQKNFHAHGARHGDRSRYGAVPHCGVAAMRSLRYAVIERKVAPLTALFPTGCYAVEVRDRRSKLSAEARRRRRQGSDCGAPGAGNPVPATMLAVRTNSWRPICINAFW